MITLSKIATLAHVSVSTVSKAFSGSNEVNEQTRALIFEIAKQHNCFKKYYNAKYPKYVIAVICPEFKSRYYAYYLSVLQEELSKHNCEICVAATNFSETAERNLLEYYTKYSTVDGIIIVNPKTSLNTEIKIPIAAVGGQNLCEDIITTESDLQAAFCEAVRYFKSKNVRNIGFIGENLTDSKLNCFLDSMKSNEMEIKTDFIIITEKRFEEGGFSAMEQLFEKGTLPRAIIAAYDNMAIGAMRSISEHGLKIPDDIAIMGMDDIQEAEFINPPLSSINFGTEFTCKTVTKAIINKITDKSVKHKNIIPYELNFRKSTEIE